MKIPKALYFVLNVLFILAIGYMLAPLPSAQSIAREWVFRIEKQINLDESSSFKDRQVQALKDLIRHGKKSFAISEKQLAFALLTNLQKQFALEIENHRIEQIIGIIPENHLNQMQQQQKHTLMEQEKRGAKFYIVTGHNVTKDHFLKGKNIDWVQLGSGQIEESLYRITSRSGKIFLLSLRTQNEQIILQFLPLNHKESKSKWEQACKQLKNE